MSKRCTHRLIRCRWIDAEESSGWEEYKKEKSWVIHTIGFLVDSPKKKTDFLVLANSHLPDTDEWSGLTRIPKGMILGVDTLIRGMPCGVPLEEPSNNSRRSLPL